MTRALRGINLGGWLVAERWMTPQLFEGVRGDGERAIGRELGQAEAAKRITHHRNTFITEADFKWIKDHGFDVVRLPVGYWLFEDDDGYVSGEMYVQNAFEWAQRYGLKLILDFHGLQGSQNGQDHSGEKGNSDLFRWFSGHERRALRTVELLARRYGHEPALVGFELINEPKVRRSLWRLRRYYKKAYQIAQKHVAPEVKLIVSDAFLPRKMAGMLARLGLGDQLVLDVHLYQVFGVADQVRSFEEHIEVVEGEWKQLLEDITYQVPVMIGEWSAALPARAYQELTGKEADYVKRYFDVQEDLFVENAWVHCYWSYKVPGYGVWDYRSHADKWAEV